MSIESGAEKMTVTYEKQKCRKAETEEDRTSQISIIHDVFVHSSQGVENCQGFCPDVVEIYSKF